MLTLFKDSGIIPKNLPFIELGDVPQGQWFISTDEILSADPLTLTENAVLYIKLCNDGDISVCYRTDRYEPTNKDVKSCMLFSDYVLEALPNYSRVTMFDVTISPNNLELKEE